MLKSNRLETALITVVVEGYFYGLYSTFFGMYCQALKKGRTRNVVFYLLCFLFLLSTVVVAVDVVTVVATGGILNLRTGHSTKPPAIYFLYLYWISAVATSLCDFFSQIILIYRCWLVWGSKARIIIIPSVFALGYLAMSLAANGDTLLAKDQHDTAYRTYLMTLISLTLSLTVNTVVSGLIVFRIAKVYRQITSPSGASVGSRLRSVMVIVIVSRLPLSVIQLFRICIIVVGGDTFNFIIGINQMLNGMVPTIELLRISMLSYHNESEKSLVEVGCTLRLASDSNPNPPISETRSIHIVGSGSISFQQTTMVPP